MSHKGHIPWNKGKKTGQKVWNTGLKGWTEGTSAGFQKGHPRYYKTPKGVKYSPETEFKIGNPPPQHKVECVCFRCEPKAKEKNVNWKGGVTPLNKALREVKEYKIWRLGVFGRDNFTCQMPGCGQRGKIEANHIKRFIDHPELRHELDNGITLCRACHNLTKGKEQRYEALFNAILQTVD